MLQNLNIDLLRTFVAVVDAGSFRRAGEMLFLSQSAVSIKIKKLEEVFGKKLLCRRQGRLNGLTEQGAQIIGHAREMLRLNDQTVLSIADPEMEGTVNLGLTDDFDEIHLPLILARFSQTHPRISLNVRCGLSEELQLAVHNGTLDAAIIKQRPQTDRGIPLVQEPLVWVGTPPEISNHSPLPLILFAEGCSYREQAISALNAAGIRWRVTFTCAGLSGIQAAVLGAMGVSALPRAASAGLPIYQGGALPPLGVSELALIPGNGPMSEATTKLLECVRECVQPAPATAC
ncbi:MAG: LysR substrate-binding domain-containing protein [Desulfovibrio sp.]|uniref:LysR substrate-binding domain-containing protein n=1 Tax=Desulfovibrio sp. 7SRBS1 TaxID=3378064 RepID=UPI003B41FD3D